MEEGSYSGERTLELSLANARALTSCLPPRRRVGPGSLWEEESGWQGLSPDWPSRHRARWRESRPLPALTQHVMTTIGSCKSAW